ncbi:MAG: diphthine--ammonia ligase, partial [Candidatus Aenigmarchaeota archaeon]|nr:diphthine--ammonia ligase [Candidatus Aenigmarchaeota archaeon]
MKLAALVSGGKDSLYSTYLATKAGHDIEYILSMKSENLESYMFHTHNLHILEAISNIMKVPIIFGKTKGVKEEELVDLKLLLEKVKEKVDGITTGAIASSYQKSRVDKICQELGLHSLAPLWGLNPE